MRVSLFIASILFCTNAGAEPQQQILNPAKSSNSQLVHSAPVEQKTASDKLGTQNPSPAAKALSSESAKEKITPRSTDEGNRDIHSDKWNWEAISAIISALATVVIAGFTISLARSTKKLWNETQAAGEVTKKSAQAAEKTAIAAEHSIQISREAYVASERPWISVDAGIGTNLERTPVGVEFGINFTVKNHGKSPAINVHIFYEVVTLKIGGDPFSGARKKVTERGIEARAGANMGVQLFPSEVKVISWKSPLTTNEIKLALESHKPPAGFLPSFHIVGSAFYQSAFDDEMHQTGFNYYVLAVGDPAHPRGSDVPDFTGTFPASRIFLQQTSYDKGTID
jgi:hypothetical protein